MFFFVIVLCKNDFMVYLCKLEIFVNEVRNKT